jgi:hypothetical protein
MLKNKIEIKKYKLEKKKEEKYNTILMNSVMRGGVY